MLPRKKSRRLHYNGLGIVLHIWVDSTGPVKYVYQEHWAALNIMARALWIGRQ